MPWRTVVLMAVFGASTPGAREVWGQQVTVTTPLQSVGERFFESTNVGFSFGVGSGSNVRTFARFGGGVTPPPFGGFDPNAGLSSGFQVRRGDFSANFGFNFAQGSQRTFTTVAPKLTLTNGVPGSLFIGTQRPFVTGVVPIVGPGVGFFSVPPSQPTIAARVLSGELALPRSVRRPELDPPLGRNRAESSLLKQRPGSHVVRNTAAAVPPSPTEQRRQRAAQQAADLLAAREHFQRGRDAEAAGKPQVAVIFYRLAARKASGELHDEILSRMAALESR